MDGTPFGRYRLLALLGRGGMGEVWRAHDTATGRVVALKLLPAHLAEDRVFQERFRREAYVAAALNEPHVIPIHNFGEIEGRLYVDMRLVEGRDLQTLLTDGPLIPARAVKIVEQVATALDAAHQVGLVHRDVKPSNVLVGKHDFAYLIDFGIARAADQTGLTNTGSTVGTWAYMAPERFSAGAADPRSDTYALACVLYECLTGCRPFPGDSVERQIASHLSAPPPRPSITQPGVPPEFDRVIATGMAKDPSERYPTTSDLANAARTALTTHAQHATSPPTPNTASFGRPTVPSPGASAGPTRPAFAGPTWPGPAHPTEEPAPTTGPPSRRSRRRAGIMVAAGMAVVVVAAGIFAAVKLRPKDEPNAGNTAASEPAGPLDGTFTAVFGPATNVSGKSQAGEQQPTQTWSIRSACRAPGCVATVSRAGERSSTTTLVLDDVNGRWVAVFVVQDKCQNIDTENWIAYSLQPRPDGTLSGEVNSATLLGGCNTKLPVTLTRTGDVNPDVEVADPDTQPPRVASPALGLHGRYHNTTSFTSGAVQEYDFSVRTDCLRSGDRCLSYFYEPRYLKALVYADGKWTYTNEFDGECPRGGTSHVKINTEYPLPEPPQDPITVLTGRGHQEETGSACTSSDFDDKFVRTGD